MGKFFNTGRSQTMVLAALYLVFGLMLCFFSKGILLNGTRIIGALMAVYGAFQLYLYFFKRHSVESSSLFVGLPCVLFGMVFLLSPESLVSIIPVLGGILLIINSVIQMQRSFVLKDYGAQDWTWTFIFSLVLLVAGVVILLKPVQTLAFVLQVVGVFLIAECIMMLYSQHELDKYIPRKHR